MCGIAGFVDFSGRTSKSREVLRQMRDQIVYRGPDSSGSFFDEYAALGIRRLSIIDLVTGDQPINNEEGSIVVVFNGEIYNFQDLRKDLVAGGHRFRTNTDTEVLVHLYEEYGEEMAKFLNGMFAFAIWDRKRQRLILARDRAGIKPLYYFRAGELIVFGSEVKTILKHPKVRTGINEESLHYYFYQGYMPREESIFRGIYKLLPGHSLAFSKAGLKKRKFFELPSVDLQEEQSEQRLDKLIEDSVLGQSIADVPLGVFLSGGTDSSLVSYYLSRKTKKLKSFSISFKEKSFDESKYAARVASLLGTQHHSDFFDAKDVLASFDEICQKMDEPFFDPSLFPTFKVSKFARRYVKVVLSGDGGDELFGGYPTYRGHIWAEKFKVLPDFLIRAGTAALKFLPATYANYALRDVLGSFLTGVLKPTSVGRHLFWMSMFPSGGGDFLKKSTPREIEKGLGLNSVEDIVRKMQILDFYTYLADDMLVKVDRASMFNSLEVRVPLLDNEVVDFAFSTKDSHVDFFNTKRIFRGVLKGKLPEEIVNRKKKGFGIPVAKWLCGELYDFAYERLQNKRLYDFFDKRRAFGLWEDHQMRRQNNYKSLWMLIMFSGWLDNWGKHL